MYIYSIPDSKALAKLNYSLLYIRKCKPEWFYDVVEIKTAYGCPCECIWNGGRLTAENASIEEFREKLLIYKSFGVRYRATFTNLLLGKDELRDETGNAMLDVLNEEGGSVMVGNQLMADYIKEKYPNLPVSWSTSTDFAPTPEETIEVINKLSKDTVVVLPYEFNNNKEQLSKLTNPGNIEVLVNENCRSNCPKRKEHQHNISECILHGTGEIKCACNDEYIRWGRRGHNVRQKHWQLYSELGINRFKIVGRINRDQAETAYFYYLVEATHRQDVNNFMDYRDSAFGRFFKHDIYNNLVEGQ
ncbi:MAG: hypothetical protein MJ048_01230 [Acidaminococcaceae bacterium]|nr:hypothetical protein [Acidaminococcaceae bacterium]